MAGNRMPLPRAAVIAGAIFLFAGLLYAGDTTTQAAPAKPLALFYTWLEPTGAPREDSTVLMAFRDPDAGDRLTVVWFLPQEKAAKPGSFAQASGVLAKAFHLQFSEAEQQDSLTKFRDALRAQSAPRGLPKQPLYHVTLVYVKEAQPTTPIRTPQFSLLPNWNDLVGPDEKEFVRLSQQPVILEVTTKGSGVVKLAATQDLLLVKPASNSFRTDQERLAANLEASAFDLLAAMAKQEARAPSSVDLRLAEGDKNAPCARVVGKLSTALSSPLVSMEVRGSTARRFILETLPSQLEVNPVEETPSDHWVMANWGLQEAQLAGVVFESGRYKIVQAQSVGVAGCSRKALSLDGRVKTENGERPLKAGDFSSITSARESEGGWSLWIRPTHGLQIGPLRRVFAEGSIHVEFASVDENNLFALVFPWLLVSGYVLFGLVAVLLFLRSYRKSRPLQDSADRFVPENIRDGEGLIAKLLEGEEAWWRKLNSNLSPQEKGQLDRNRQDAVLLTGVLNRLVNSSGKLLEIGDFPSTQEFPPRIWLHEETRSLLAERDLSVEAVRNLNRLLLEGLLSKFIAPVQSPAAESGVVEPPPNGGAEGGVAQGGRPQEKDVPPVDLESTPRELAELRRQIEILQGESDRAKAGERSQENRFISEAAESARLRQEVSDLKAKRTTQANDIKKKTEQIKDQKKDLEAKDRKIRDLQSENGRLTSSVTTIKGSLQKKNDENANLRESERALSTKVEAWKTALRSIGSNPEEIAEHWDRETGWLKMFTDAVQAFFQAADAEEATAALKGRLPKKLSEALDTLGTEMRAGRTLVEEILRDLANEQGTDNLVRPGPNMGAGELRLVYQGLRQQRAAIDRVRKRNPRIANVIWVIEEMRQLAELLARMAADPGARLLTGTLLEPAPLATALQGIAEKSEERWNEMQRTVAGPERGIGVAAPRAFEDFLDWFLDGERLQTLTNILRLAQVVKVYCEGASDTGTEEFYKRSVSYCEECLELQKRFGWIGVQLAPISFFKPPQIEAGWAFHENGDGHPLIFESYSLKKLAVNKAVALGEDVTRAVGDVSTWGFHCDGYEELRSDTRGWLCRGWRTL